MLVLIHSPLPVSVGVMTSGWGRPACSPVPTSGTTGRLNATVIVFSVLTWSAPSAGWVFVTSSTPAVVNLKATGRWSGKPAALVALSASVTWYSALRFSGSAGEKVERVALHLDLALHLGLDGERRTGGGGIHRLVEGHDYGRGQGGLFAAIRRHADHGGGAAAQGVGVGSGAIVGCGAAGWLVGGTAGSLFEACAGASADVGTGGALGAGRGPAEHALRMTRTSTANRFRE